MVTVDEREVEAPTFIDESWQCDLRFLSVMFDQLREPCLFEKLQTAVGESPGLVRVDDDVPGGGVTVREQPFTDKQRGDGIAKANLDRASRAFACYPLPQRLSFGSARGNREQAVDGAIRTRDGGTVSNQTLDHLTNLSQCRP